MKYAVDKHDVISVKFKGKYEKTFCPLDSYWKQSLLIQCRTITLFNINLPFPY